MNSLQTPRSKPRQRRIDPLDRIKELPPLEVGGCYRYKYEDGYRVFVVLGFNRAQGWLDMVYCAILEKTYSLEELKMLDVLSESVHSVSCYIGLEFLSSSAIKKISNISVPEGKYMTSLSAVQVKSGQKKDFKAIFINSLKKPVSELLNEQRTDG